MSDSLANERTLERPSDNGQVERASAEQSQGSTSGPASNGQPAQENISKLQSIYDRKLAEQERRYQQQLAQQGQVIRDMQGQMREARKQAAPDDFTRLQIDVEELARERDQYAQAYNQTLQAQQAEQQRKAAINDILQDFDQLTPKELDEAIREAGIDTDDRAYAKAYKLAAKLQQEKAQRKQEQDDDKRNRNLPDVGGGAPRSSGKWEDQYADAQRSKDTPAMMRLLRERDESRRK